MSERDYLVSKSLFRAGRSAAKVGRTARKTAEVTGANADEVTRAFRNSLGDVDQSVARASMQARKVALVGGAAVAGGLSVPVAVHHTMAGLRDREKRKSKRVVVKAMSPNKLRALSRMSNGGSRIPRQQADYARNRLASYRVGEGASPSPSLKGRFVEAATNASARAARNAKNLGQGPQSFNAGITNSSGKAGGYNQSIAARKLRMNNSFRSRPSLP